MCPSWRCLAAHRSTNGRSIAVTNQFHRAPPINRNAGSIQKPASGDHHHHHHHRAIAKVFEPKQFQSDLDGGGVRRAAFSQALVSVLKRKRKFKSTNSTRVFRGDFNFNDRRRPNSRHCPKAATTTTTRLIERTTTETDTFYSSRSRIESAARHNGDKLNEFDCSK